MVCRNFTNTFTIAGGTVWYMEILGVFVSLRCGEDGTCKSCANTAKIAGMR